MQRHALFLVLEKYELLDKLVVTLSREGIRGATILNSTGMANTLVQSDEVSMLGSLRLFLSPPRNENRTIFMILDEYQLEIAKKVIYDVVGDLSQPDTGILFAFPLSFVEGLGQ